MESDSDDSDSFIPSLVIPIDFKEDCIVLVSKRDISAYMQHITDVCDPPR